MGLLRAIQQLADTANAVPSGPDDPGGRHARYHRRIVFVGGCFAAVGVVFGLLSWFALAGEVDSVGEAKGLLLAPAMYGAGGFVFGVALACLVAPRAFLAGPAGAPWMKLVGTESVLVARVVCLLFGLVVSAPLVGFGLVMAIRG